MMRNMHGRPNEKGDIRTALPRMTEYLRSSMGVIVFALVLAAAGVFVRYYFVAKKQFGGTTGDLAGWFLQKCEIWMLAALAACQWLGVL